jgi:1-acyl-sn-glycerol-3-phosphate acyltransferase
LFPEGSVTWDGRAGKVYPGIGRLINKSQVPVVGAKIDGVIFQNHAGQKKDEKGQLK